MTDLEMDLLIANARIKALEAQLAAERAKYTELQRYNVDCTKQCDALLVEKIDLKNQLALREHELRSYQSTIVPEFREQLAVSKRREQAAVKDMEHIASEIEKCDWALAKDGDLVGSLHLGRCAVCSKRYCDDEIGSGCKFEWRDLQEAESVKKQPVFYNCPACGCVVSDLISACPKCGRELRGPQEAGKGDGNA